MQPSAYNRRFFEKYWVGDDLMVLLKHDGNYEKPSPSLLLVRVLQRRDIVTALQLLHDFHMHVFKDGIHRLVWWLSDPSFNVFVDYATGPGEWALSHCCIDERLVIEIPHNHEFAANFIWDLQLMSDIPIHQLVLAMDDLHLQVQSCPPAQHAEECSALLYN